MNVAIVDDSMLVRLQFKKFFEEVMSYNVIALGSNGNEAVELCEQHQPDLLVMDLAMPEKCGYEALIEIMKKSPDSKVLICSATKNPKRITSALNAGAKGYIKKPLLFTCENWVESMQDAVKEAFE